MLEPTLLRNLLIKRVNGIIGAQTRVRPVIGTPGLIRCRTITCDKIKCRSLMENLKISRNLAYIIGYI